MMNICNLNNTIKQTTPIFGEFDIELNNTSTNLDSKEFCIIKPKLGNNKTGIIKNLISNQIDNIIISQFKEKNNIWSSADFYYALSNKNIISKATNIGRDENKLLSYQNTLVNSKKYLGLSVAALSTLLDVTRPTIYAYLNGNEPKDKSSDSIIIKLNKIINIVTKDYSLKSFSTIFKRRDENGETLTSYLKKENANYLDFVQFLCKAEVSRQSKIVRISSKNKSNLEKFSVPILYED
ncbi:MAG: hypothetical protein ACPKM0_06215 [Pleomorphochaeta sp.]